MHANLITNNASHIEIEGHPTSWGRYALQQKMPRDLASRGNTCFLPSSHLLRVGVYFVILKYINMPANAWGGTKFVRVVMPKRKRAPSGIGHKIRCCGSRKTRLAPQAALEEGKFVLASARNILIAIACLCKPRTTACVRIPIVPTGRILDRITLISSLFTILLLKNIGRKLRLNVPEYQEIYSQKCTAFRSNQ